MKKPRLLALLLLVAVAEVALVSWLFDGPTWRDSFFGMVGAFNGGFFGAAVRDLFRRRRPLSTIDLSALPWELVYGENERLAAITATMPRRNFFIWLGRRQSPIRTVRVPQ